MPNHIETCDYCTRPISGPVARTKDDKPMHQSCFERLFPPNRGRDNQEGQRGLDLSERPA